MLSCADCRTVCSANCPSCKPRHQCGPSAFSAREGNSSMAVIGVKASDIAVASRFLQYQSLRRLGTEGADGDAFRPGSEPDFGSFPQWGAKEARADAAGQERQPRIGRGVGLHPKPWPSPSTPLLHFQSHQSRGSRPWVPAVICDCGCGHFQICPIYRISCIARVLVSRRLEKVPPSRGAPWVTVNMGKNQQHLHLGAASLPP